MTVEFVGTKAEPEIRDLLIESDAFVLPTKGENFGHAVFEAMSVGTPVIVSDQTIWRGLREQNAGWDLSISTMEPFRQALSDLIAMTPEQQQALRQGALKVAQTFVNEGQFTERYEQLFRHSAILYRNGTLPRELI